MRGTRSSRRGPVAAGVLGLGVFAMALSAQVVGSGVTAADSTVPAGSSAPAGSTPAGGSAQAGGQVGPGDFGDLKGVCGPGDGKGSTAQGVTDTEIVVGTVSDTGAQIMPGLTQELFDTADAFVGWCNAAGGINGRKLKLNKHDAKLVEAGPAIVEACQSDFMLVGNGEALDIMAFPERVKCGLPEIAAYVVSEQAGRAEGSIAAMPNSDKQAHLLGLLRSLAAKDPEAVKYFGMWNNNFASVTPTGNRTKLAAEKSGFTTVVYEELPSLVDNYRPFVEKLKEKNVQVLVDYHSPGNMVQAFKAMADVGYFPKYVLLEGNFYDQKIIDESKDLLDKMTVLVNSMATPFESADANPATTQFVKIVKDAGFVPRGLGVNAWSSWLLFAKGVKECGTDVTRECVMEKAKAAKGWTGGGLHVPLDPSNTTGSNSECVGVIQATSAGFVAATDKWFTPNKGEYFCDPANITPVDQL